MPLISLPLDLVQSAISAPSPSWGAMVQSAAAVVVVSLQGWLVKSVREIRDEQRAFRQHLFGLNGDNGMNSQVKTVERRLERHDEQLATHDKRLTVVEYEREHPSGRPL